MIQNTTTTTKTNIVLGNDNQRRTKTVVKDDDEEFVTASIEIEEEASDDLTSSDDCRIGNNSGEYEVAVKTRASLRIGDRFQAVISNSFVKDCVDDLCGELVSAPSDYETQVESETTKLSALGSSSQRLGKDKKSIMESWSNSDIEDFEKGMLSYPKQFDKIKREMKRSKKLVKDLVEFYYVWKTLERYQDWEDERARREMERRKARKRLEVQDFDEFYGEKKRKLSEMLLEEEEFKPEPKKRRVQQEEQPHAFDYFDENDYDSIPFLPPPLENPEAPSSLWDEPEKPVDSFQNQIENYSNFNIEDRSFVSHQTPDFLDFTSIEATDQFNQKLDVLAYFPPLPENDVFSFMDPLE